MNVINFLKENPEMANEIEQQLRAKLLPNSSKPQEKAETEEA